MSEQTNIETPIGCPFCGKTPTVKRLQSWGCEYKHLVACRNAACPVNPSVTGATRADAIRRWNTRDAKTQDVLDEEYRIATSAEKEEAGVDEDYALLIGPDGFECVLTEPEDRTFRRDLKPLVIELNRLLHLTSR